MCISHHFFLLLGWLFVPSVGPFSPLTPLRKLTQHLSQKPTSDMMSYFFIPSCYPQLLSPHPGSLWAEDRKGLWRLSDLGSDLDPVSSTRCIPFLHLFVSCQWVRVVSVSRALWELMWYGCVHCMILGKLRDLSQLHRVFVKFR